MATDVVVDIRTDGGLTAGAVSLAWNATITGGLTNSVLVGTGTTGSGTAKRISTFQWDAAGTPVSLTNFGFALDSLSNCYSEIWLLINPSSGTKQLKITPTASCEITGGSGSYQWVNQTTPWNPAGPQSSINVFTFAGSLSITSALHEKAISCMVENNGSTLAASAGQTVIHNENIGVGQHAGISSDKNSAAGSTTLTYTGGVASNTCAHIGGSLQFDGGTPATPIPGKSSGSVFQVPLDLIEIPSNVIGKTRGGGAAPTPPSYRPQLRLTTPFDDDFDYFGTVNQCIGAGPGILPKTTVANRLIANPFWVEPEFNFNQSQTKPAAGGAAPPTKSVYNHIFTNPQFNDTPFEFANAVIQTGNKKGASIGLPRRSIKNPSDIAIQIQNELIYWDSYFKAISSKPSQGGSSPQPGSGALLLGGFIGVHVGVGRL